MKILFPDEVGDAPVGGKAGALLRLKEAEFRIPKWFAVLPGADLGGLGAALARLGGGDEGLRFAVRSSAVEEDGAEHSFAGQFDSFLDLPAGDVAAHVVKVWDSGRGGRIRTYCESRGIPLPSRPCAIVQRMLRPDAAGVAFSADPVSGERGICVVSAVLGVGERLVSGEADADTFRVDAVGVAERTAEAEGAIGEGQAAEVAVLARGCEEVFGVPQDIEWAYAGGSLHLLQSRPITSLGGDGGRVGTRRIWDNSNIAESYSGVTTPLTFTFARRAYAAVYEQFCRLMRVPGSRIASAGPTFSSLLGLVRGRVYYNLVSWYRVLALLPGFRVNRGFMEGMMGVKTPMPEDIVAGIVDENRGGKLADALALAGTLVGLFWNLVTLPRQVREFYARLEGALDAPAAPAALGEMSVGELADRYRELESRLLKRWDAPLVNDFFAMVFFGLLGKLCGRWLGEGGESLHNDLIVGGEDIVSMEPARRIREMAVAASASGDLVDVLRRGEIPVSGDVAEMLGAYIRRFGDRCLEELKLESATLEDDAAPLFRAVGNLAARYREGGVQEGGGEGVVREAAEGRLEEAGLGFVRGRVFGWVLAQARARVRDRENLRFERTRVFGQVRRIMVQLGRRLAAAGVLEEGRDIFYLELEEVLGVADGTGVSAALGELAAGRKVEFARYAEEAPPPDRFSTYGPPALSGFEAEDAAVGRPADGETLAGIGCCAGVVRGRARVVTDPAGAVLVPGEILVARQTDPGWVMLFPSAAGLLVERGSLLSHSAIVSREMGIPAVVSLPGLLDWVEDGEELELDGRAGTVRKVSPEEG